MDLSAEKSSLKMLKLSENNMRKVKIINRKITHKDKIIEEEDKKKCVTHQNTLKHARNT